jgi:precorrin-2 dehydrogenase/sirohydrochlorin ferrochelatase
MSPLRSTPYPANLVVDGRKCLVVGGGPVAARRARDLAECGASVHVIAPDVGDDIRSIGGVTWDERPYESGDAVGYWLVIAATDDIEATEAAWHDASEHGLLINAADDPERCTFVAPARIRRGPLLVTVSTGGHSPALARWLRARFEHELGPEYETLVGILSEERAARQASGSPASAEDWQRALDSGMLELIREGRLAEAKERLQACLSSSSD